MIARHESCGRASTEVPVHLANKPCSVDLPSRFGPRNCGQSAALRPGRASEAERAIRSATSMLAGKGRHIRGRFMLRITITATRARAELKGMPAPGSIQVLGRCATIGAVLPDGHAFEHLPGGSVLKPDRSLHDGPDSIPRDDLGIMGENGRSLAGERFDPHDSRNVLE